MSFLQGKETLTAVEWALRAIIAYFFLLAIARVLGQRTISQLRLLDFVIALVIGNIIAHPLSDEKLGLKGSVITTAVLTGLYLLSLYGILKYPKLRKLLNNSPIIVVQNGEILYKGLNKARISIDVLLEELREAKVEDVKKVALAIWEADGQISIFLHPQYEPITPSFCKQKTEPFYIPKTVIKEGKIDYDELKQINKSEEWIISSLKKSNTNISNVLLGTIDNKDNLNLFLYK
jgi:uncharacterized membrane protein YcaP (DUF421 family)